MGRVQDIKGKIVDYQVTDSANNLNIGTDEELGKLTAVIRESETEPNSLYVGDVHIASGYGFDNLETLAAVENLLKDKRLRDILDGNTNVEPQESTTPDVTPTIPENLTVNVGGTHVHNDYVSVSNGEFKIDTWLTVSDIKMGIIVNSITPVEIKNGETYVASMLDDIKIKSISFKYDLKKQAGGMYDVHYRFEFGNNYSISMANSQSISLNASGQTKQVSITNINEPIVQDTTAWNTETNITLIVGDEENTSIINLGKIIFKYPVFATTTQSLGSISGYNDKRVSLYTVGEGAKVEIPAASEDSFNYIWIPSVIATSIYDRIQFIFSESNIGCYFNPANGTSSIIIKNEFTGMGTSQQILYNMYRSPKQYKAGKKMIWLVK